MNFIIGVKFQVSPPLVSVLTTQPTLTEDKILFVGPHHLPKIVGQKDKSNH